MKASQRASRDARRTAARRAVREAVIDDVWSRIPDPGCRGLCWRACGPIGMSGVERARIARRYGITVPDGTDGSVGIGECPALTVDHRCAVYALRPTICRLWGAADPLPCPHGCVPPGGRIDDITSARLLVTAIAVDGPPVEAAAMLEAVSDPGVARALGEAGRAGLHRP